MLKGKFSIGWTIFLMVVIQSCSSIEIFKENTELPLSAKYNSFVIVNAEVNMNGFSAQFLDEKVQDRIRESFESQGLTYDRVKPDLIIRYTSNEDLRQRQINTFNNPYQFWGMRVWDPWMFNPYSPYNDPPRTDNYELLQVIIDFIDPEKDKFLMTLTGVTEVNSPKYKEKKVLKTTEKVVERFISEIDFLEN
ncbi:DUF4136 domain-containing protein [uncultured Algoriphagus sp.]|uniref:DUF4136 domain-containing protein n=1 Tax=uncultured Algoriphagus sp. TaxID=417365 RepID=UPI0025982601|nr:DUF4136 domain-containing protein [uncultured Algoriphagus sp.]